MRDPFLVAAFSGWGDASNVATTSAAFLLQNTQVDRALDLDPEEYFVLTETRPWVRVVKEGERRIEWPTLAVMRGLGEPRDAAVLVGPEPQLRWRSFAAEIVGFWKHAGGDPPGPVVLLGAFLAGVSHSDPVVLTGFATTPELRDRLTELGVHPSVYEGPTSCHSVLADAFSAEGIPCCSVWAAVPHYVGQMPNPKASVAVLRVVDALVGLGLDLAELEEAAQSFERQVSVSMARSGQTLALGSGQPPAKDDEPLPSAEELVRGAEEFLRRNQGGPPS